MASSETPREMMAALIEGRRPKRRVRTVLYGRAYHPAYLGQPVCCSAIFSYGLHFPMAIRDKVNDAWFVNMARRGITTAAHQRGIREALVAAGYTLNEEFPEVALGRDGFSYARYAKRATVHPALAHANYPVDDELVNVA